MVSKIALYLLAMLALVLVTHFLKEKLGTTFKIISAIVGFILTALVVIQMVTDVPVAVYIAGFVRRIIHK